MLKVTMDTRGLKNQHRRYTRMLEDPIEIMLEEAEAGAQEERESHRYRNRTGNLEESVRTVHDGGGDPATVHLIAGSVLTEDYTQVILQSEKFGNLSDFDEIGAEVGERILERLRKL